MARSNEKKRGKKTPQIPEAAMVIPSSTDATERVRKHGTAGESRHKA